MPEVQFSWYPDPLVVADSFYEAAGELEDMTLPLELSLAEVLSAVERTFEHEGPGWQDWAESYVSFAETHNESILTQSGDLRSGATSPEAYDIVDNSIVWTGMGVPETWVWHEEGLPDRETNGKPNPLPARPFIGLDTDAEVAISGIFLAWLDSIVAGMSNLKGLRGEKPLGSTVSSVGVSGFRFRGSHGRFT